MARNYALRQTHESLWVLNVYSRVCNCRTGQVDKAKLGDHISAGVVGAANAAAAVQGRGVRCCACRPMRST